MNDYIPDKEDLVWLDFNPSLGSEQRGRRPGLILTPTAYNTFGLCYVLPITSVIKGYSIEVPLTSQDKLSGVILTNQLKAIGWRRRKLEFIEKIDKKTMEVVNSRLRTILSL